MNTVIIPSLSLKFVDLEVGDCFYHSFSNTSYMKLGQVKRNEENLKSEIICNAVCLRTGSCHYFADNTLVTPIVELAIKKK